MHVEIEIPEISAHPQGFPSYWLNTLFVASVSTSYQVNALASTYIRIVEAALVEYRMARPRLQEFWDEHRSVKLSAMHRAIAHFEACLTDMHPAIACFTRLRRHKELPDDLNATLNVEKPSFIADKVSDRLRDFGDLRLVLGLGKASLLQLRLFI